jgi:surface antigen
MRNVYYIIALAFLILGLVIFSTTAHAGGVWSDQYCNVKTETVITKDTQGKVINKEIVETLVCDDGAKDFLAYSGIAKECKEYWFDMYISQQWIRKKGYVCQKFDGSWEMVNPIK